MLWAITSYYNPHGYTSRWQNYQLFRQRLAQQGVRLLTVECAFRDQPFTLSGDDVVHVRSHSVLWQKERLLNYVVQRLPANCTAVAWLDADILFENAAWGEQALHLLHQYPVVQPFESVVRLFPGAVCRSGGEPHWAAFAAVLRRAPNAVLSGSFPVHGHTGFAWVARRSLLASHELFDACIAGSGDHVIAHALAGDWESACLDRVLGRTTPLRAAYTQWAKQIYAAVRAKIGYVPGCLLHLWHGERAHRQYVRRNRVLLGHRFDPACDIEVSPEGCWEWASNKPRLHEWLERYFAERNEDDFTETSGSTDQCAFGAAQSP